jgi:hypothetical protein
LVSGHTYQGAATTTLIDMTSESTPAAAAVIVIG